MTGVEASDLALTVSGVSDPNGFDQLATLAGVSPPGDGLTLQTVYSIVASGEGWDGPDDGLP